MVSTLPSPELSPTPTPAPLKLVASNGLPLIPSPVKARREPGFRPQVELIQDTSYVEDGGLIFGSLPRPIWMQFARPNRLNQVRLGVNQLLIQHPSANILVDTGVYSSVRNRTMPLYKFSVSRLNRDLRERGLTVSDIDVVVLTGAEFWSAGGILKLDRMGSDQTRIPKATHFMHERAIAEARKPSPHARANYMGITDLADQVDELTTKISGRSFEIVPGVEVLETDGPAPGSLVVMVSFGAFRVCYPGALIPTFHHLNPSIVAGTDINAATTIAHKQELKRTLQSEGWTVALPRGWKTRLAMLSGSVDQASVRPDQTKETVLL